MVVDADYDISDKVITKNHDIQGNITLVLEIADILPGEKVEVSKFSITLKTALADCVYSIG